MKVTTEHYQQDSKTAQRARELQLSFRFLMYDRLREEIRFSREYNLLETKFQQLRLEKSKGTSISSYSDCLLELLKRAQVDSSVPSVDTVSDVFREVQSFLTDLRNLLRVLDAFPLRLNDSEKMLLLEIRSALTAWDTFFLGLNFFPEDTTR